MTKFGKPEKIGLSGLKTDVSSLGAPLNLLSAAGDQGVVTHAGFEAATAPLQ
jgi:hypothetical protein